MSQAYDHNGLLAVLESIALLNENHVANKIGFEEAARRINAAPVQVCNNGSISGHHNGNSVIGGVEYENHYIGGYHYFKLAND